MKKVIEKGKREPDTKTGRPRALSHPRRNQSNENHGNFALVLMERVLGPEKSQK